MKNKLGLTMILVLSISLCSGIALAQSSSVIKVNIPFDFKVGHKTLSAGQYSVIEPLQHLVQLRDPDGHVIASTLTRGVESKIQPPKSHLNFNVVDGEHVLAQVWREGDQVGEQLQRPKRLDSNEQAAVHDTAQRSQP
jgi:hypothetical protein